MKETQPKIGINSLQKLRAISIFSICTVYVSLWTNFELISSLVSFPYLSTCLSNVCVLPFSNNNSKKHTISFLFPRSRLGSKSDDDNNDDSTDAAKATTIERIRTWQRGQAHTCAQAYLWPALCTACEWKQSYKYICISHMHIHLLLLSIRA